MFVAMKSEKLCRVSWVCTGQPLFTVNVMEIAGVIILQAGCTSWCSASVKVLKAAWQPWLWHVINCCITII